MIVSFIDIRIVVTEEQQTNVIDLCAKMYEAEEKGLSGEEAGQILLPYMTSIFETKPVILDVSGGKATVNNPTIKGEENNG